MNRNLCLLLLVFLNLSVNVFSQSSIVSPRLTMDKNKHKTILSSTEASANHKTLLQILKATDLDDALSKEGPFTVFAPSDLAFEKLSKTTLAELLEPKNKKELQSFIGYHIIAGNFSASKILLEMCRGAGKAFFTTIQGDILTATMTGVDIILTDSLGNSAKITSADFKQSNGVIHEIDTVFRSGN